MISQNAESSLFSILKYPKDNEEYVNGENMFSSHLFFDGNGYDHSRRHFGRCSLIWNKNLYTILLSIPEERVVLDINK